MDINAFSAAKTYGAAQKLLKPETKPAQGESRESGFNPQQLFGEMTAAIAKSESAASAYMVGAADPHSVVEALASAELAVETAVTLRNRVVEAYQELMRMPV
ncbi:MAG: flagellar hook-basal body complex protein FliE [Pseudomonadota bacterium]|nr:flagellar hook-basal body complex protein FliE [Pseudomonadota bacterium]